MADRYSLGRWRVNASFVSYRWLSESKTGKSQYLGMLRGYGVSNTSVNVRPRLLPLQDQRDGPANTAVSSSVASAPHGQDLRPLRRRAGAGGLAAAGGAAPRDTRRAPR